MSYSRSSEAIESLSLFIPIATFLMAAFDVFRLFFLLKTQFDSLFDLALKLDYYSSTGLYSPHEVIS